jgi:hypothetical protein
MQNFENRLLGALAEIDAQRPAVADNVGPRRLAPARPHWMRASLVGTAVALVVGAVTVGTLAWTSGPQHNGGAGRGGQPAAASQSGAGYQPTQAGVRPGTVLRGTGYVLEVHTDGSVDFTASDLLDPAAATAALNSAGIAGQVAIDRDACAKAPADWDEIDAASDRRLNPRPSPSASPHIFITGSETVTLHSSDYPAGGGLLVVVAYRHHSGVLYVNVGLLPYKDVHNIPSTCVQRFDPGTGDNN